MTEEKKPSSLLQFAARPATPEQSARLEAPPQDKEEYRAADVDRTGGKVKRIHIEESNGTVRLISYAYFVEAISTSDKMVSFIYTNGALLMEGVNLRSLLPALQDENVTALRPFNPDRYMELTDDKAPIIDRLEWRTIDNVLSRA